MAEALLGRQFVVTKWLAGRKWRLTKGAGPGYNYAGDLADLCLYELAEKSWAAKAKVMDHFGILFFLRGVHWAPPPKNGVFFWWGNYI